MAKGKIRVHNRGKRDYTFPPAKKGGKDRLLPAGRAIEIEKELAEKMIEAYPADLIEFDSLVSGEKKNLSKENDRLEAENASYLETIEKLKAENEALQEDADPDIQKLKDEHQWMVEMITEIEREKADPNEQVEGGYQKKEESEESETSETEPETPADEVEKADTESEKTQGGKGSKKKEK